ncbi:MAG: hypothetical protein M1840_008900 [Geoglossum simile]|nr:MAG: hypothetical protein M1840_008900 [Geoglossum simile]
MLVQWLYLGRVVCIEITGMETQIAEHIKDIILLATPDPKIEIFPQNRGPDSNTYSLAPQHITSAALLPNGHPVRRVLATASVEGYIRRNKHKFLKEILEAPNFAADLLLEVKETLKTVTPGGRVSLFRDPLSGERFPFSTEKRLIMLHYLSLYRLESRNSTYGVEYRDFHL